MTTKAAKEEKVLTGVRCVLCDEKTGVFHKRCKRKWHRPAWCCPSCFKKCGGCAK